ncbi:MAG: SurA N-terminal domain-containing protein [Nitrospiraceae bacterium]|jgi:peptidyl-prolyl cis-trans isomerase D|nr:MAG: SurA N-terminal domain-containing protein [Nitrospiraceae bacterium]
MLKSMRQHAKYFYVLFFIVILSFIFWGVGTVDQNTSNVIAELDNHKIPAEEYWRAYDRALRFYRDIYKDDFDEAMEQKLNIRKNVLNTLIENRVLLVIAQELGITVTDEELHDAIKHEPSFLKDGVFDRDLYFRTLKYSRITAEAYESIKREERLITKARQLIKLTAYIPEDKLTSFSSNQQTLDAVREAMVKDFEERTIKSYIAGRKKSMKITIYDELI